MMKLTKFVQLIAVGSAIVALSACSSTHKNAGDVGVTDMNGSNGAQSSGMGEGANFNDSAGRQQLGSKRTYYFDFDSSDIHEQDRPAIFANADYLVAHPGARVTVEGHTDPRGSREYNVALGERRARAVADILKSKGVSPDQIRVVSYGAERLAASGRSEQDYQLDRRVVIVYS